ncbi:MAG: alkaline phosphatase [Deltaproteobacteria bacterium]|nr:alkaline phosphatase [Deltaproteobacteria bacterium]
MLYSGEKESRSTCSTVTITVVAVLHWLVVSCDLPPSEVFTDNRNTSESLDDDTASDISKRHIILFIGDGMHLEHEIAASRYLFGTDDGLVFHDFEYQGFVTTWSVTTYNSMADLLGVEPYSSTSFNPAVGYDVTRGGNKPYPLASPEFQDEYFSLGPPTDSAASITAMMTGTKTSNGNLSWLPGDPPNGALLTIVERLGNQGGYAIGGVSTVPFNHATPAGVFAHNISRYNYSEAKKSSGFTGTPIAEEIIRETKPEVVIGGGHIDWIPGFITRGLYDDLAGSNEYVFVERIEGASGGSAIMEGADRAVVEGKKLWGLFGGSQGNFEPRIPSDTPGTPGFMVNPENPTLAEAARAALTVLARDPDGFMAVFEQGDLDWANHDNNYYAMIGCMNDLNDAVEATVEFIEMPGDDIDWTNTLLIVTADHATGYMRLSGNRILGVGDLPRQVPHSDGNGYGYPDGEVAYGSTAHTNELVMIYARGDDVDLLAQHEGQWYPGTRIIDVTHIFETIGELTGAD